MAWNNLHFKVDGSWIILLTTQTRIWIVVNFEMLVYCFPRTSLGKYLWVEMQIIINWYILSFFKTLILGALNLQTENWSLIKTLVLKEQEIYIRHIIKLCFVRGPRNPVLNLLA